MFNKLGLFFRLNKYLFVIWHVLDRSVYIRSVGGVSVRSIKSILWACFSYPTSAIISISSNRNTWSLCVWEELKCVQKKTIQKLFLTECLKVSELFNLTGIFNNQNLLLWIFFASYCKGLFYLFYILILALLILYIIWL